MLVDLDKAKEIVSEFDKYKTDPIKLYKDAQNAKVSVSDHLESLDPTQNDDTGASLTPGIDAFVRHLMAIDLQISGPNQCSFEKFSATAEYLVPEMVLRFVREGMEVSSKYSYKDCIATTVPSSGIHYHPLYIPELNLNSAKARRDKSAGARPKAGKGGEFPRISIRTREKDIVINDIGRVIEAEYSVIKDYPIQEFATLLRLIGAQMAADKLQNLYDLGVTGDGTVGAAHDSFAGTGGTLAYTDIIDNQTDYEAPFIMSRIIAPQQSVRTILAMAQFQDPQAGWKFQNTGEMVTPMGAQIKQVSNTPGSNPTGTVIVTLDDRFAAKEVINENLTVEADKIISRKFEEAVVSEKSRFCIIADGALRRIVWS